MDSNAQSSYSDEEYEAIEAAVMETARGRWFLAEYAKRNRVADTCTLLDAINKLEHVVVAERSSQDAERIRFELSDIARTLTKARREIVGSLGKDTGEIEDDIFAVLAEELKLAGGDDPRLNSAQRAVQALRYMESRVATLIEVWGTDDDVDIQIFRGVPRLIGPAPDHLPVGIDKLDSDEIDWTEADPGLNGRAEKTVRNDVVDIEFVSLDGMGFSHLSTDELDLEWREALTDPSHLAGGSIADDDDDMPPASTGAQVPAAEARQPALDDAGLDDAGLDDDLFLDSEEADTAEPVEDLQAAENGADEDGLLGDAEMDEEPQPASAKAPEVTAPAAAMDAPEPEKARTDGKPVRMGGKHGRATAAEIDSLGYEEKAVLFV